MSRSNVNESKSFEAEDGYPPWLQRLLRNPACSPLQHFPTGMLKTPREKEKKAPRNPANCRPASKQCYQESLTTWRSRLPITFILDNEQIFLKNEEPALRIPLETFLDYCNDPKHLCSKNPFRFIKMIECEFSLNLEQFKEMWLVFGSHLTTLHLNHCKFQTAKEFRKVVFRACPKLRDLNLQECIFSGLEKEFREPLFGTQPHLKNFQLRTHPNPDSGSGPPLPVSWWEFLDHFPNLTQITVELDKETDNEEEFIQLTDAIRIVRRHDSAALPLKFFDMGPTTFHDSVSEMRRGIAHKLGLPLKFLILRGTPHMSGDGVRGGILELRTETAAKIGFHSTPLKIQLRDLTALKIKTEASERFQMMTALKYTPDLEQLVIFGVNDAQINIISDGCKLEMSSVKLTLLVELRVETGVTVSDQDLASLFDWIPNLTKLEMTLNDRQFVLVCGGWKTLKSLKVFGGLLTDEGVTGLPTYVGGRIMSSKNQTRASSKHPNITDLQKLEYFEFWSSRLTKKSAIHGLSQVYYLRKVQYGSTTQKLGWGKEARKALWKKSIELVEKYNG